jgi:hypothetical protein
VIDQIEPLSRAEKLMYLLDPGVWPTYAGAV